MTTRFCKDCEHCRIIRRWEFPFGKYPRAFCYHPEVKKATANPVTGEALRAIPCEPIREMEDICGPTGKLWQEKRTVLRWINNNVNVLCDFW